MLTDEFVTDLVHETVQAIAEGSQHVVLWGIKGRGLAILSALNGMGLISFVSGLIDNDATALCQSFFGIEVQSPEHLSRIELDTLVIASDEGKEAILSHFAQVDSRIPRIVLSGQANYEFDDTVYLQLQKSCLVKSKAGGYAHMLVHLYQSLKYVAIRKLQGDIAEFGVYQGGTTVFIAKFCSIMGIQDASMASTHFLAFLKEKVPSISTKTRNVSFRTMKR